jgi:hypothetical protein
MGADRAAPCAPERNTCWVADITYIPIVNSENSNARLSTKPRRLQAATHQPPRPDREQPLSRNNFSSFHTSSAMICTRNDLSGVGVMPWKMSCDR